VIDTGSSFIYVSQALAYSIYANVGLSLFVSSATLLTGRRYWGLAPQQTTALASTPFRVTPTPRFHFRLAGMTSDSVSRTLNSDKMGMGRRKSMCLHTMHVASISAETALAGSSAWTMHSWKELSSSVSCLDIWFVSLDVLLMSRAAGNEFMRSCE